MWRAFFLAVGFFVVTLGAECLVMDRFVMASEQPQQQVGMYTFSPLRTRIAISFRLNGLRGRCFRRAQS